MSYPILKPNSSWFAPTVFTIKRDTITTINIVDTLREELGNIEDITSEEILALFNGSV